jgi:hypothetical protein
VADAGWEDRSLGLIATVPQGGLTWFMEGDDATVLDATDEACSDAVAALGGEAPIGVLAFDCVARLGVIGDLVTDEIDRLGRHTAPAPIAGFYSYGEIARVQGPNGFHNQTLVVLAVA